MHKRIILVSIFILVQLWTGGCNKASTATPAILPGATLQESLATSLPPTAAETPGSSYPAVDAAEASLKGLPIDQFFDDSFKMLMLRDPETVTIEGLSKQFGMRDDQLTNVSDAYIRETQAMQVMIADLLKTYDRAALASEQQISYDVYAWYLDDLIRQQKFMYNDYPINLIGVLGVQYVTLALFTDYQPVTNLQEAQDYVSRLGQVGAKFEHLIDGLKRREQAGIVPPSLVIQWSLNDIQGLGSGIAKASPFYKTLMTKVNALQGVSAADKQAVLDAAAKAINESVIPAYQALGDYMEGLLSKASDQDGVWQFANGEAYYNDYLIPHMTTGDMSAEQLHQLGLKEIERIQAEMRVIFDQLGYPKDESLSQLFGRVAKDGGTLYGEDVLKGYEQYIDQATQNLDAAFDLKPKAELVVIEMSQGIAYYSSASMDGSRPGAFYVPVGGSADKFGMPTLAHHEGVPGHHFQVSIAREADLPLFRNVLGFNAYAEGWALYAEKLAAELGWYQDNPYGDLGRLQAEAWRAGRLVVDAGIHTKQWTFNQAVDFLVENTGMDRGQMQMEVGRYIAWPGQALGYDYGLVKLLELRQKAKDQLGEQFDLKEFHNVVLSNGSLPLAVLERVVDDYIASKQGGGAALPQGSETITIRKLSDFPLYEMRYNGDYGFGQYLKTGAVRRGEALTVAPSVAFGTARRGEALTVAPSVAFGTSFALFSGSPASDPLMASPPSVPWACTGFAALNAQGEKVFGRNFDWYDHPAMILFTDSPDGYASVSMVDLFYLDYQAGSTAWMAEDNLAGAPYLPFDGMNEHGLVVGMMAIGHAEGGSDPQKVTLDELELIRLMLDYARTVDEALALLGGYNVDFGAVPIHYLIADATGASAVVEYIDGEPRAFRSQQPWQASTNFLFSETDLAGASSGCWRYDTASAALEKANGALSPEQAMGLLKDVSQDNTLWSIVYNMDTGAVRLALGRAYEQIFEFTLQAR